MELVIRDGKFFRNGKVEPIKIGDADQIKVLKQQVEYIEEISNEGIMIDDLLETRDRVDDGLPFRACKLLHSFSNLNYITV